MRNIYVSLRPQTVAPSYNIEAAHWTTSISGLGTTVYGLKLGLIATMIQGNLATITCLSNLRFFSTHQQMYLGFTRYCIHSQFFSLIFESGFNMINFWEIQNMKISCRHRIACKFQNSSLDIQMGVFLQSTLPVPAVNCTFHILKVDAAASLYFLTP